jgi:hypothetical protein
LAILDDRDVDRVISRRLAAPLPLAAQQAFRDAASAALAEIQCPGEGIIYRVLAPLQRAYFAAPTDLRAQWDIAFERPGVSKLIGQPTIEHDVDGRHVRYRQHPKAEG